MKKSSLKNYIAFLEAAAAANASDHWMRQYELKDKELLKAKDEIAELKRMRRVSVMARTTLRAKLTANATDYWMRQYDLKDEELLKAKDEIAELKRRLLEASPTHQHNHNFERNHNGTQA